MKTPIVIVGFGTTSRALETYSFINERLNSRFSDTDKVTVSAFAIDRFQVY